MKIYGLIGNPLGHSFSQKYFIEKFTRENITGCRYVNFELKNIEKEIALIKNDPQVFGLNVTIPYKSEIIAFLNNLSPECQEVNACNCIQIAKGKWTGFNTDITGFEKSFTPLLKSYHTKALVLGTGGSSKAVAYVLKKLKIDFLFVSRKKDSSKNIVDYDFVTPATLNEYPVVINTTPTGMFPNVDACPQLPYDAVTYKNYFFDLIYNPSTTLFLSKAAATGAQIKNGEKMLAIQAEESWRIWNTIN
jgi:shikimate dehydrogenase